MIYSFEKSLDKMLDNFLQNIIEIQNSTILDIVAISISNGNIFLFNIKNDEILFSLK